MRQKKNLLVETKEEPAVETKEEPAVETKEEPAVETKEEPAVETKEDTTKTNQSIISSKYSYFQIELQCVQLSVILEMKLQPQLS